MSESQRGIQFIYLCLYTQYASNVQQNKQFLPKIGQMCFKCHDCNDNRQNSHFYVLTQCLFTYYGKQLAKFRETLYATNDNKKINTYYVVPICEIFVWPNEILIMDQRAFSNSQNNSHETQKNFDNFKQLYIKYNS